MGLPCTTLLMMGCTDHHVLAPAAASILDRGEVETDEAVVLLEELANRESHDLFVASVPGLLVWGTGWNAFPRHAFLEDLAPLWSAALACRPEAQPLLCVDYQGDSGSLTFVTARNPEDYEREEDARFPLAPDIVRKRRREAAEPEERLGAPARSHDDPHLLMPEAELPVSWVSGHAWNPGNAPATAPASALVVSFIADSHNDVAAMVRGHRAQVRIPPGETGVAVARFLDDLSSRAGEIHGATHGLSLWAHRGPLIDAVAFVRALKPLWRTLEWGDRAVVFCQSPGDSGRWLGASGTDEDGLALEYSSSTPGVFWHPAQLRR